MSGSGWTTMLKPRVYVCHLARVVFFNNARGLLAEQLSGILSFVSRGNSLSVPQVQRTASQVETLDGITAEVSVIVLTACQVAWSTQWAKEKNYSKCECVL